MPRNVIIVIFIEQLKEAKKNNTRNNAADSVPATELWNNYW